MARRHEKARRKPRSHPRGILEMTSRGFGFVKTAEGEFFIPESKINGAFSGDLVEISRISPRQNSNHNRSYLPLGRKPTARIHKVLIRSQQSLIGRYELAEPFGVVVPLDPKIPYDIFTLRKDFPDVADGSLVEVELIEYPSRSSAATGRIKRVFDAQDEALVGIELIISENKLETSFSDQVLEEAKTQRLDLDEALDNGYVDLRDEFIFTIDPVDARDFDDAISLTETKEHYHLGVHIADVSHYVVFNSALDLAARRRGCSVYLVDRVLNMLPDELSCDLCSLRPGEDRRALSVLITLNKKTALIEKADIQASLIRSSARLSYDQAQCLLEASVAEAFDTFHLCDCPQESLPTDRKTMLTLRDKLLALRDLSKRLFRRRYESGCMDFNRIEARARLDADGIPIGIDFRTQSDATQMIEEAMILANHVVAKRLSEADMPCIYRVHGAPDSDMLHNLYEILQEFDQFKSLNKRLFCAGNPHELQKTLSIELDDQTAELINTLLLRSMKQAIYTTQESGHYGLALDYYCHFTSPIRRYPDLVVHRFVHELLFGKKESFEAEKNTASWIAEHASEMERVASKAEYDSHKIKMIEYLQNFIGNNYEAIVCNISTFGLTLRLPNTVKGFLPVRELGDEYFSFDPQKMILSASESSAEYRLGQKMRVVLTEADPREQRVEFRLLSYRNE